MKVAILVLAAALQAGTAAADATSDATTLALVTAALEALPACGLTCIMALPEWTSPLTLTALGGVCANLQKDIDSFETCVAAGCTNATDLQTAKSVVALVPTGCTSLGYNTTNITFPAAISTAAATKTAVSVSTTKTGASVQVAPWSLVTLATAFIAAIF